jgi:GGDEF domain-containing protein
MVRFCKGNGGTKIMEHELQKCKDSYKDWLRENTENDIVLNCEKTGLYTEGFERNFFYNEKKNKQQCKHKPPNGTFCFDYIGFLDMVAFKAVNDRFSHSLGDELLRRFGHLFNDHFNKFNRQTGSNPEWIYNANAFRHGGDEFTVLLSLKDSPCCERLHVDSRDENARTALRSNLVEFKNKWAKEIWSVQYGITVRSPSLSWDVYNEKNTPNAQLQEILLKGLNIRCGVGTDIDEAENEMKGDEVERGVFNEDCKVFIPVHDDKLDKARMADENEWCPLRDYIIYIMPQNRFKYIKEDFLKIIEDVMLPIKKFTASAQPTMRTWIQRDTVFICVPVLYNEYAAKAAETMQWCFSEGKFPMSRMAYTAAIKSEICRKPDLNESAASIYYLTGKSITKE